MKALVGAYNQKEGLVGAFSVIVKSSFGWMELIKTLAIKNDFHYHKDRTQKVETIKLTRSEEVGIFIDNNGRHLARLNIVCFI